VGPTWQRGERGQRVPVWGGALLGRGLVLVVGWNGSRGPVSYFSLLCFFSFSIFPISFTDFAKCFKTIQTTFREFLQKSLQGFKSVGNKFSESKQDF
jgi:hypothetical protein